MFTVEHKTSKGWEVVAEYEDDVVAAELQFIEIVRAGVPARLTFSIDEGGTR